MLEHGRVTSRRKLAPGLYEDLVDAELDRLLAAVAPDERVVEGLEPSGSAELLARYVYARTREALGRTPKIEDQRAIVDALLGPLELAAIPPPARRLLALAEPDRAALASERFAGRPSIPLAESELLVNARGQIDLAAALISELRSADRVDLVCSFIKRTGLARLEPALRELCTRRPGALRILTTTYTGVTEGEALARLTELGAEVRVDYGGITTRLHAKAWVLQRASGLSTAYVGSSNISHSALVDGREWNVRLSARENPDLLDKLGREFEALWADAAFAPFERERFEQARSHARGHDSPTLALARFDLRPFAFQDEILDKLAAARELHDRHRNLIVAATGTGKTMIAAFDYARVRASCPRLLFVAHRKEILAQARGSFAAVLRDPRFGELLVDGQIPRTAQHVFASIQSLRTRLAELGPEDYDYVVIDEFHHAEAPTYQRLLERIRPRELLGLTATPERADGQDPTRWFSGHVTAELRLWDALERGLLCPFHYFAVADEVDLSHVAWQQGGYDRSALDGLYTGNHARARRIAAAIQQYVPAPESMRALGFCVSVGHAEFMAKQFAERGIAATVVVGTTPSDQRESALARLRTGELRVVFCVDVFNEGVDLPEVDTLLFLRPTESATLFLQQLGRGLRKHGRDKVTTVLDFIGNAHRNFRFDHRFRALLGPGRGLEEQIEREFPWLPPGCAIVLEPQARKVVLANVKSALAGRRKHVVDELRSLGQAGLPPLEQFLVAMQWQPEQLYRAPKSDWSYTGLAQDAGLLAAADRDDKIARGLACMLHVDDRLRLTTWRRWLGSAKPPKLAGMPESERRLATMLVALLIGGGVGELADLGQGLRRIWKSGMRDELLALLELLERRVAHVDVEWRERADLPLRVHARYTRDELLAACGALRAGADPKLQTGMRLLPDAKVLLNLVTIDKTSGYSPKTQYRDHAISRTRFHSETPHTAGPDTALGRHILDHVAEGTSVLLFVRARPEDERGVTAPYVFLGPTRLLDYQGDRPMQLTWALDHAIPAWFYPQACLMV